MKKITYISIALIITIFVLFRPVQNFYLENQRIEREAFIDEFLASKQILSYKDSKKLPKALRPDLKGAHDYLMMYDLKNRNNGLNQKWSQVALLPFAYNCLA